MPPLYLYKIRVKLVRITGELGIVKEKEFEEILGIRTSGRDASKANTFNYPYEPTDYRVLRRLVESGYINKKNHLIDYGSGKGRVPFYISYEIGCSSIGIEYDERLYGKAIENREHYLQRNKVDFICINAAIYQVPERADRFYFFNPFSIEILSKVIEKIIISYYEFKRDLFLFFYYPSDEYMGYLMGKEELIFVDEIECEDIFPGNKEQKRERILVFEVV